RLDYSAQSNSGDRAMSFARSEKFGISVENFGKERYRSIKRKCNGIGIAGWLSPAILASRTASILYLGSALSAEQFKRVIDLRIQRGGIRNHYRRAAARKQFASGKEETQIWKAGRRRVGSQPLGLNDFDRRWEPFKAQQQMRVYRLAADVE